MENRYAIGPITQMRVGDSNIYVADSVEGPWRVCLPLSDEEYRIALWRVFENWTNGDILSLKASLDAVSTHHEPSDAA